MNRLRVYTVHIDPSLPHPYEEAEFVEEGFNWKAFIFGGFWALYHKMWLPALGVFAVDALLLFLINGGVVGMTMQLGWHLIVGYLANDWLRDYFKKHGFITADVVTGDSLLRAEQRFFDRYFSNSNPEAAFS